MEDDYSVLRGGHAISIKVGWKQGIPVIPDFTRSDVSIRFYRNRLLTSEITSSDPDYRIGDETLAEIIQIDNFIDYGNGEGEVIVIIDPSDITAMELMMEYNIWFTLNAGQPGF